MTMEDFSEFPDKRKLVAIMDSKSDSTIKKMRLVNLGHTLLNLFLIQLVVTQSLSLAACLSLSVGTALIGAIIATGPNLTWVMITGNKTILHEENIKIVQSMDNEVVKKILQKIEENS